jgi:hypothetical protein
MTDRHPCPTRAQRRAARDLADDTLVRTWLDANYNAPLGALHAEIPLSGRRLRRALGRLLAAVEA